MSPIFRAPIRHSGGISFQVTILVVMLVLAACNSARVQSQPPNGPNSTQNTTPFLLTDSGALRLSDGSILWTHSPISRQAPGIGSGLIIAEQMNPFSTFLTALRQSDGATVWTFRHTGSFGAVLLASDRALVPIEQSTSGTVNSATTFEMTLVALRLGDGSVLWQTHPIAISQQVALDVTPPFVSRLTSAGGNVIAMTELAPNRLVVMAWNLSTGHIAWQMPLDNAATYAGPDGSLEVTGSTVTIAYTAANNSGDSYVTALNPATGRATWPQVVSTPSLDLASTAIDVISNPLTGTISGLNPQDGAILWQLTPGGPESGREPFEAIAESTTTIFYRLFTNCPNVGAATSCPPQVFAISTASGKVLWHRALAAANPFYAVTADADRDTLYYQYFSGPSFLMGFDANTGVTKWTRRIDGNFGQAYVDGRWQSAIVTQGKLIAVIAGRNPGGCPAMIDAFSGASGTLVWENAYPMCSNLLASLMGAGWIELAS